MIIDKNNKPNYLKITEVWAFISVDEQGNEGVCAFKAGSNWIPMICADEMRIKQITPVAQEIAKSTGQIIKLIKLSNREDVQTL